MRALLTSAALVCAVWASPALAQNGPAAITGNDAGEWKLQCGDQTTYLNLAYSELNIALSSRLSVVVGTVSKPGSTTPDAAARVILSNPYTTPCTLVRIGPTAK